MCDAIYIKNTQQTFKKKMDGHLSDVICLLRKRQKSYSFAAHFEQHFQYTTSRTDLRKCMMSKLVKQINPIGAMKTFMKPNCNLCMEKCLTIPKNLRDKRVTIIDKNLDINRAFQHKTTSYQFFQRTDDTF